MLYIYLDESGDLGFSKSSSKWFVFSGIVIDDKRLLEQAVKKVWKNFKNKERGELHATHESGITKKRLLKRLVSIKTLGILSISLYKQKIKNG